MSDREPTRLVPLWRVAQVYQMAPHQILDAVSYIGLRPLHYCGQQVLTGKVLSGLARFVSINSRKYGDTAARLRRSFPDAPTLSHAAFVEMRDAA